MSEEVKYIIETTETNIGYIHNLIKCIKEKQFDINRAKYVFKHNGSVTNTFFRIEFSKCYSCSSNVIYTFDDMMKILNLRWMIYAFDSFESVKTSNYDTNSNASSNVDNNTSESPT